MDARSRLAKEQTLAHNLYYKSIYRSLELSVLTNIPGIVSCDVGGYFRHFISGS